MAALRSPHHDRVMTELQAGRLSTEELVDIAERALRRAFSDGLEFVYDVEHSLLRRAHGDLQEAQGNVFRAKGQRRPRR